MKLNNVGANALWCALILSLTLQPVLSQDKEPKPASQFDIAGDFHYVIRISEGTKAFCVPQGELTKYDAQLRFGDVSRPATVVGLCLDRAVLEANQESPVAPTSALIRNTKTGEFQSLLYVPGLQYQRRRVSFYAGASDAASCPSEMGEIEPEVDRGLDLLLYPEGDVKRALIRGCTEGRLILELSAPAGYVPKTLFVTSRKDRKVYVFQSTPGSTINSSQPNVGFSVVDDKSVEANFGSTIAKQYVVIDLQVRNPSTRKIQLRKSALWFEVDYRSLAATPTHYLFGKDHQFQHAPHDFLTVMGTFDGSVSNKEKLLKVSDIALTALAGATIFLSDGATLYPKTIAWIAGIVNPTMRSVLFSEQDEKRRRNQMLTQSFADIIQISPQSSVITKVFLPRKPINVQFKEPVIVDQVRDIHLYLEVVSEVVEEVIAKGQLRLGLTMDQVSTALGYPDNIAKSNDQTIWKYNTGKFESLVFNAEGKLIQWSERKIKEQITQLIGSAKAEDLQKLLGLVYAPSRVDLKDGSFVWLKPGNLDFDLVFSKGSILDRINDKPGVDFLGSLEHNIRMPETETILGSRPAEERADRLGGRIWIKVSDRTNFQFDRDRLLVNTHFSFTDLTLEEQKKNEDANYTRKIFESELAGVAAGLLGDRKTALDAFKTELEKAGEGCKSQVCIYPAPESPELEYQVKFSSADAAGRFESIRRQVKTVKPPAEPPKAPEAKPAKK